MAVPMTPAHPLRSGGGGGSGSSSAATPAASSSSSGGRSAAPPSSSPSPPPPPRGRQAFVFALLFVAYAACYLSKRSPGYWGADAIAEGAAAAAARLPLRATPSSLSSSIDDPSPPPAPLMTAADNDNATQEPQVVARSAASVGSFSSAFESLGGVSKVVGGFLVDWYSPSAVLAGSLLAVGATHGALLATPAFGARLWLWAANGLAQAFAWPALAKVFLAWYPAPATRGKMYALLATSQNAGAAVAPYVLAAAMARWGWQGAIMVPGVVAGVVGALVLALLSDRPPASSSSSAASSSSLSSSAPSSAAPAPPQPQLPPSQSEAAPSLRETARMVFTSVPLWLLAISYFFNTLVRNALTEVPESLLGAAAMGVPTATRAAAVSAYEVGAAVGGLAAGWVSDRYFGGRRGPVMALFSFAAAPLPLLLLAIGGGGGGGAADLVDGAWRHTAVVGVYAALGLTAFAPHMLNGLAAREWTHPGVQSTAGGFSKAMAQAGGTVAGLPLGLVIDAYGWQPVMVLLAVLCAVAGAVALPLWNTMPWRPPTAVALVDGSSDGLASITTPPSTPAKAPATPVATAELRKRGGGRED